MRHQALTDCLVNVALKRFDFLGSQAIGLGPVMYVHAFAVTIAITIAAVLILLLLENVEHLFGVHATEPFIAQAHRLTLHRAITVDRHRDRAVGRVQVFEHQVDHVVHRVVGESCINLVQSSPRSQVSVHLVPCLVRHNKVNLWLFEHLYELAPIPLVSAIGTGSWDVVIHPCATDHHHTRQQCELGVAHQTDLGFLQFAFF